MSPFLPRDGHAPDPTVPAQIRAYWEALRGTASFPRRDQIDPRGIAGALDQTFLIERIAPGLARFRLAGMRLSDGMGMDLRGMPVSALIAPPDRDRFARALEPVFATPSILDARLRAERSPGRPARMARMLVLPLGDRNGQPVLALGCLALADADEGRGAPRRFAITALLRETLAATRPTPVAPAFAEPAVPFPTPAPRAHLRLVHDATRTM
ncbi:MAG: PAS domain-containing protein [Paracoccaceae bacterium]